MAEPAERVDSGEHGRGQRVGHNFRRALVFEIYSLSLSVQVFSVPDCQGGSSRIAETFLSVVVIVSILVLFVMFVQGCRGHIGRQGERATIPLVPTVLFLSLTVTLPCWDVHLLCWICLAPECPMRLLLEMLARTDRLGPRGVTAAAAALTALSAIFAVVATVWSCTKKAWAPC